MKYFLSVFIFTLIVFQFFSCDGKNYNVAIENKSDKIVSYVYNDEPNTLLPPKDSVSEKHYIVKGFTPPPKDIKIPCDSCDQPCDHEKPAGIKILNQNNDVYTFINIETE
ncbi:MAG: hypothetical protein FWC19_09170 [Treponema sp.]|nr:hypothetical protein [Treponema sp.]MCL2272953.1 hypothetical protein [Treponema sp.]